MKKNLILAVAIFLALSSYAQQITQTIRGTVIDGQSKSPLLGATISISKTSPPVLSITDEKGNFAIARIPIGRVDVLVSYVGYREKLLPNILITAGREVFLTIELEEDITQIQEIVISSGRKGKASVNNEMATVGARALNVEETTRYAGSRNDVARMATNFAGVSGANDARNDIIIRGNSPAGVLWRLDGINIPNPNHYGGLGATGGAVSMLNTNVMDKSDFLSAAFPAQYGNALAGVFDIQLRSGNKNKHEFLGQIGFNGFELGAEGPFSENKAASYLVNYRYSTLGIFKAMGLSFGTGVAVPLYQDITYKVDIPTSGAGKFSIWGLGGKSSINILGSEMDSTKKNLTGINDKNIYIKNFAGIVGLSHQYYFTNNTFYKLTLGASSTGQKNVLDSLTINNEQAINNENINYQLAKYSAHLLLNKKVNAKRTIISGIIADLLDYNLNHSKLVGGLQSWEKIRNSSGYGTLLQAYSQVQNRFTNRFTVNGGINLLYFTTSKSVAIEPRLGLKYKVADRQLLSAGYGFHSQIQPLITYFVETPGQFNSRALTNKNLGFTKSHHFAIGYDNSITPDLRLKIEAYFQNLNNVPVEISPSSFSILNASIEDENIGVDNLVNKGFGRNVGIEFTLEKFYSKKYYYLFTVSLFNSRYKGSDNIMRNTAYNGKYVVNVLAGKEFELGTRKSLNIDWKLTSAGGRYGTPIDLNKSREVGMKVLQDDQAFSRRFKNYFRTDLKLSYRINRSRLTHEISIDIQNLTNARNIFLEQFNKKTKEIETEYQLGIFPIPQYRILF